MWSLLFLVSRYCCISSSFQLRASFSLSWKPIRANVRSTWSIFRVFSFRCILHSTIATWFGYSTITLLVKFFLTQSRKHLLSSAFQNLKYCCSVGSISDSTVDFTTAVLEFISASTLMPSTSNSQSAKLSLQPDDTLLIAVFSDFWVSTSYHWVRTSFTKGTAFSN